MNELTFDVAELVEVCRRHNVKQMSVFGSVARGEAGEQSDIDLLVSFSQRISLLRMVALERQLSSVLGRKVDLSTEAAISPYLRERIKRGSRVIYEAFGQPIGSEADVSGFRTVPQSLAGNR